jgi:SAM-dependent methyltransferase
MHADDAGKSFGIKYAQLYDLLHGEKDYGAEVSKILAGAAGALNAPVKTVIDMACGTGRHAENFAKAGVALQINDLSEGMLSAALNRVQSYKAVETSCGPMQKVQPSRRIAPNGFDLAVATYTAMGYLTEPDSLNAFLINLSRVLKPGGVFFADLWNGHRMMRDFSSSRSKNVERDGMRITRRSNVSEVRSKNALQVRFEFLVDDITKKTSEAFEETHVVRYHTPCEIETLFNAHSLEVTEMGPYMEESATLDDCWNFFVFARKR